MSASDDPTELSAEECPNCGAVTLRLVDDMFTEIERRVFEGSEMWACACGYSEERLAPEEMSP